MGPASAPPLSAPAQAGPLAPPASAGRGSPVDGISCQQMEQGFYHIHAHLSVFVGGSLRSIPAGIGITPPQRVEQTADGPFVSAGGCFYWLHTHDSTGVIHIESPTVHTFTLGDFFDVWGQPLGSGVVGPARSAPVHVLVNGSAMSEDPRQIPLTPHAVIQLNVGGDVPFQPFSFPPGL
jgi:hypothetical protein